MVIELAIGHSFSASEHFCSLHVDSSLISLFYSIALYQLSVPN